MSIKELRFHKKNGKRVSFYKKNNKDVRCYKKNGKKPCLVLRNLKLGDGKRIIRIKGILCPVSGYSAQIYQHGHYWNAKVEVIDNKMMYQFDLIDMEPKENGDFDVKVKGEWLLNPTAAFKNAYLQLFPPEQRHLEIDSLMGTNGRMLVGIFDKGVQALLKEHEEEAL